MSEHLDISEMLKKNKKNLSYQMPEAVRANLNRSVHEMGSAAKPWYLSLQSIAASFGIGIIAASAWFTLLPNTSSREGILVQEVVSAHVRSMMVSHLSDVVSTDQHTVKPWFAGKLDFSPVVKDLAEQGY